MFSRLKTAVLNHPNVIQLWSFSSSQIFPIPSLQLSLFRMQSFMKNKQKPPKTKTSLWGKFWSIPKHEQIIDISYSDQALIISHCFLLWGYLMYYMWEEKHCFLNHSNVTDWLPTLCQALYWDYTVGSSFVLVNWILQVRVPSLV